MGSLDQERDGFEAAKVRINNAFEHLRSEMKELQRQDIMLFKELMYIRHIILLLSNYPDRRSYSISALDPSAQNLLSSLEIAQCRRPNLSRVQSAPLERNASEDTIPEEDDDQLIQSFNSAVSDTPTTMTLSRPSPETDFIYALAPLPPVLKRLLECSPGDVFMRSDSVSGQEPVPSEPSKANAAVTCGTHYDSPLHDYFTRRKMLQRQKSIDEQHPLEMETVVGTMS